MQMHQHSEPRRPLALLGIAMTLVLLGGLTGVLTNSISGAISPRYFRTILRWQDMPDEAIWRASIAQGLFEGLIFGFLCAVVFSSVIGIYSRVTCTFCQALPFLLRFAAGVLACWVLGGLLGMALPAISMDFYRHSFRGVPDGYADALRYAWVGGSIWGAEFGAVLLLLLSSIQFVVEQRVHRSESLKVPVTQALTNAS